MQQELNSRNRVPRGVYFDMDNTLFDFVEAKLVACEHMTDYIGCGNPEDMFNYFLRRKYHFEHHGNIHDYMVDKGIFSESLYIKCCEIYGKVTIDNIRLYPNVIETLESLKMMDISIAIVTDAYKKNALKRLKKAGICDLIDKLITRDISGAKKPDLEVFRYALDEFNYLPREVMFVGDSIRRDIEPAQKIGMLTAYAAYGDKNSSYEVLLQPDHVLADIIDVISIIKHLNHTKV